jgi:GTP-binding protein
MTDLVKLTLRAGQGGHGRVSFRREKYVPKGGPDGGKGGDGGNIIIRGSRQLSTLSHFAGAKEYKAESGQAGGKRRQYGRKGEDLILEVPLGTTVWLLAENETSQDRTRYLDVSRPRLKSEITFEQYRVDKEGQAIPALPEDELLQVLKLESSNLPTTDSTASDSSSVDKRQWHSLLTAHDLQAQDFRTVPKQKLVEILDDGQEVVISQGGFGGRGNDSFKSSTNTTPLEAEYGTRGEVKVVALELRLLADIGLVGFPNAGKSTLLSVLTNARPKVGNYPFTTLEPHLGVMAVSDRHELVIADIPGVIEGAHQGKGLGHAFLRHIENCTALLFVLALDESLVFDESETAEAKAERLIEQYHQLQVELDLFSSHFKQKKTLIAINKVDIYSSDIIETIKNKFDQLSERYFLISGATGEGLEPLKQELHQLVFEQRQ